MAARREPFDGDWEAFVDARLNEVIADDRRPPSWRIGRLFARVRRRLAQRRLRKAVS